MTSPNRALLLIDLQNDFLDSQGAYARAGQTGAELGALPARLTPVAQAMRAAGGMVVASRFTLWPDANGEPMVSAHLKSLRPFLAGDDFAPGSRGQAVIATLQDSVNVCVDKVAYSAFFNTQLDWVLRHAGVQQLIVAGIVTQGGVASTVRDAHVREYPVTVLSDGCATFKQQTHDAAIEDMKSIATITDCQSFLKQLQTD